jgi:hypothetical protein
VNQFYYQFNLSKQRSNFHFHSLIKDIKPYSTFYDTIILLQIQKTFHIFIYLLQFKSVRLLKLIYHHHSTTIADICLFIKLATAGFPDAA